jgi:predicted DNA binding protein
MRRLILEFSIKEFKKVNPEDIDLSRLEMVKTMEILQILKDNPEEVVAIARIQVETSVSNVEDYVRLIFSNSAKVQLLDREKDGSYIVFIKLKWTNRPFTVDIMKSGGYAIVREIKDGNMKLTLLGNEKQLKLALEKLKQTQMNFKVMSLTDARFASDSPLNTLTEKQRRVLTIAYELGYYDLPRKINSEQLAKRLNIKRATLIVHRRKAERRVLSKMFTESIS